MGFIIIVVFRFLVIFENNDFFDVEIFSLDFPLLKFEEWYAEQVKKQLDQGKDIYDVDVSMKLSDIKPKHANWLIGLYDHLRNSKEMILESWKMAGLEEAFDSELPPEDPFADLD